MDKVKSFFKKFIPYKPYIDASLDLGFFRFRTEVMHQAYEMYAYKYIAVRWKFFKWDGNFTLYRPGEDIK